ncbi:adenylyltransferase/cytidyltransferase family protein [Lysobacter enzymogenes]|uniref:adenylyltransferase/cytidyltransferase family protein n=1 Tax=Lysobacter enzymogenes TaxID=69 RepID=UPI001F0C1541|nr:adenylyltransferase/cytidyltransferase family protein [Lysobacter enzymogenes]
MITFGTFDLLHQGHLRILERARALGERLVVGVSTDRLNEGKGKRSFFDQRHRLECVAALRWVDQVFYEDSLQLKDEYIRAHDADLLVMGDDWSGQFDWVSCPVAYLPRTPGVSSSEVKFGLGDRFKPRKLLFGDTYLHKHHDCALALLNAMTDARLAPILTASGRLPERVDCDAMVYFNLPAHEPPMEYSTRPRILIDHGASHLKWFLADPDRFAYFDAILTAGPDHVRSLLAFFPDAPAGKVRSAGFAKSAQLLSPARLTRCEAARRWGLDPDAPIVLFAPTWHISNNRDVAAAIGEIAGIANHIAVLHPETAHLDVSGLNLAKNESGTVSELIKHADCVVSDLSSTLFEAAALGKSAVQVLLGEYPDNNALVYDFPYTAGTAELFCGGLPARPGSVARTVTRALSDDPAAAGALQRMRERILRGTLVTEDAPAAIAADIALACETPSSASPWRRPGASGPAPAGPAVRDNLRYARNRLIADGGGRFGAYVGSATLEALECAATAVDFISVSLVRCADGVVLARAGEESRYGLDRSFAETSCARFETARYMGELTPLKMESAVELCINRDKVLVCDLGIGTDYAYIGQRLCDAARPLGALNRVVARCASVDQFDWALKQGFAKTMLVLGPGHEADPLGNGALAFVDACLSLDAQAVVGIVLPFGAEGNAWPDDPRLGSLLATWKRVYVEGAPIGEYQHLLNANLGVFAEGYSERFGFADHPSGLHWPTYLFLHPDVADAGLANPVGAALHYLRYGRDESRRLDYAPAPDFDYACYIDMNPSLRDLGVSGPNTALAHWTRSGSALGWRYRR